METIIKNLLAAAPESSVAQPEQSSPAAQSSWLPQLSYFLILGQVAVVLVALLVCCMWLLAAALRPAAPPQIYINQELATRERQQLGSILALDSNLFQLQAQLDTVPWLAQTKLTKILRADGVWLVLELEKERPLGRLANGDLVYRDGAIARSAPAPADLPLIEFSGTSISTAQAGVMAEIAELAANFAMVVSSYELKESGALEVQLATGALIKLSSYEQLKEVLRLREFLQLYSDELSQIQSIDLRHTSGIAVLWSS